MSSKILGSLSPVYGLLSGKGAFGKLADSGLGGIIPSALAADRRKRKEKEEEESAPQTGHPRSSGMNRRVAIPSGGGMKNGGKVKKYQDGGVVGNSNYPFGQGQMTSAAPETSSGGFSNSSPLVQVNAGAADTAAEKPFGMKKGGAVKATKSHRGDGIAKRGRTKGRFV